MKVYNTKTQAAYDELMTELEEQGFNWLNGKNPTYYRYWKQYGENTCIEIVGKEMTVGSLGYYKEKYPKENIIEYKAKGENNMKIYHTATRKDYDSLMIELESKGCKWPNGEKPTEQFNYNEYMSGTTITTYADSNIIRYACVKDDMEISPDEPIIEYKAKGDNQMLNTECKQCKKKWHNRKAKYCSMCGEALVAEPEFKVGDIVASKIFSDGSFGLVRLNEDLTNRFTSVDGFWYIKRDCEVIDGYLIVFKEDTRHATPEEILEYESALNFHNHGREPFEVKYGDILSDREPNIFFVNEDIEIWNKEDFISGDFTFLKTAEEVNEWLENK